MVMQRVVKKALGSVVYPTLTRMNYTKWALVIRVNLQTQGLWEAIEPGGGDYRDDRLMLSAILRTVPPEMLSTLVVKDTAKDAWDAIKMMHVGVERVREANAQKLRRELSKIEFKDGKSVNDFAMRITSLANNLQVLGNEVTDVEVVRKFLQVIPERLQQVAISIETLLDLSAISIEEVTGRLRVVEQRYKLGFSGSNGRQKLLLTEEEWLARMKKCDGEGGSSSGGNSGSHVVMARTVGVAMATSRMTATPSRLA